MSISGENGSNRNGILYSRSRFDCNIKSVFCRAIRGWCDAGAYKGTQIAYNSRRIVTG